MSDQPSSSPPETRFWHLPFPPLAKQAMLIALVSCFGLQTMLVYTDPSPEVPIKGEALRGRKLWHEHNCGSCHQFFGFGGFLGPDLTNAAPRLTDERLHSLLTQGSGAMPAFHLQPDEISAIRQFLVEMNKTGQGQALAAAAENKSPWTTFEQVVRAELPHDAVSESAGLSLLGERGCFSVCHSPLRVSGIYPDLVKSVAEKPAPEIHQVLLEGRAPNMPVPDLNDSQRNQVYSILAWVGVHRDDIQPEVERLQEGRTLNLFEIPWWEY